jgi:dihydropteroate synthase
MTMIGRTDSSGGGAKTGASPDLLGRLLALNRPVVMGILNITPDSFSDGGQYADPAKAFDHAQYMIAAGADIIDIGAESTRPYVGAKPVSLEEELARLAPILPAVVNLGVPVSIDTIKPQVAAWALTRGAAIVNDVWGLQRDGDIARVVAEHGVPVIIMHNRHAADPSIDIMADIAAFFSRSSSSSTSANWCAALPIADQPA